MAPLSRQRLFTIAYTLTVGFEMLLYSGIALGIYNASSLQTSDSGQSSSVCGSSDMPTTNSVCIWSIFPPIWHTSYEERSGFGCGMNYDIFSKQYPEYTRHCCTNDTPWEDINVNTISLMIGCNPGYNNSDFALDIKHGVLGNYSQLETLSITSCQLQSLSNRTFAKLSRLSTLLFRDITGDMFSFEVFGVLPNIKWIGIDKNHYRHLIHWYNYCHNQKLEYMTVVNNNISKVKIENTRNGTCPELRLNSLVLEGNPIHMEERMFEYYHVNGVLNIAGCSISKLEASFFYGLEELQDLDIEGNLITELPDNVFSSMTSLIRLRLNANRLTYLDVEKVFAELPLQSLRLENNFISRINGSFSNISGLSELDLANNSLKRVKKHQFGNMIHLKSLDLSLNLIESIEHDTFSQCLKLETLNMSYNRLTTIYALHLKSLRQLYLYSNFITHLDCNVFKYLTKLHTLGIQRNNLSGYGTFELLTCDLDYFDMSYNQYSAVNVTVSSPNCFNEVNKKFTLNASHNVISSFNFQFPTVALTMDFSSNNLDTFRVFSLLTYLQELRLRKNKFSEVSCYLGISSENMTVLDLGENVISHVCKQSLSSIKKLHALYLDNNKLAHFDPMNVSILHLSENPLGCSCDNEALKNWLLSKTSKEYDNITCVTEMNSKKNVLLGIPDNCDNGPLVRNIIIAVLSTVAFILGLSLVVFKFKYEIQVIAFYKWNIRFGTRCCKCTVSEQNNYAYDAFICFAEDDVQYVRNVLIPILEPKYRVCIYHRDFPVGEDIAEAILNAIENSALTIVVLSRHFMRSRWGRYEFKQAHYNSMRHEHQKLLIIVIDKAVLGQKLDLTLKSILFSKAYLTNDDVLFKEKLLHAIPVKTSTSSNDNAGDTTPLLAEDFRDG